MSIQASEMVWRRAAANDDTPGNGGRMTHVSIPTGVKNNIFPDVPQAERAAGSTKYRKVFIHIANDDDLTLIRPRVFVETFTPGDDAVTIFPGTFTDTQSGITGSERKYGAGQLNANVSAGASEIAVLTEDAALATFQTGDLIRISDKTSVSDATGTEEYIEVTLAAYVGDVVTLTLATPLANAYLAAETRVASVYEPADIEGAVADWVETSGAGTFNEATYPVQVDHIGGIEQNWTITFTSPTAFNCVGDTVGSVGTGNTSSDFQPTNPNFSVPYFVLPFAGFGGSWIAGNTITFRTSPAAIPLWYRRDIPAGAASLSGNRVIVGIDGESE